jgi:hypothetical protein
VVCGSVGNTCCEDTHGFEFPIHLHGQVGMLQDELSQPISSFTATLSSLPNIPFEQLLKHGNPLYSLALCFGLFALLSRGTARREHQKQQCDRQM